MYRLFILIFFLGAVACRQKKSPEQSELSVNDSVYISVDEAFRPVIEEQAKVYQALNPGAPLRFLFKPEAECWNDLYRKEVEMVVVSKSLSSSEAAFFYDSIGAYPQNHLLAYDAIALVVNKKAKDSVFTLQQIHDILTGKSTSGYQPVFDGVKATSSVRFALDSILKGETPDLSRFLAAKSSNELIEYVQKHPEAIGFVGVSWIGNPEDNRQQEYRRLVNIAWLSCRGCTDYAFTFPAQEEIYLRRYPFTRSVYAVVKEKEKSRAAAFVQYMKSDRGQLLFRRSYLVPSRYPFIIRETRLNTQAPL